MLITLALATVLAQADAGVTLTLHGRSTAVYPWCGGSARPTGVEQLPRPYAQSWLLKRGAKNTETAPVATITPAADGTFTVKLEPGTYCAVLASRAPAPAAPDAGVVVFGADRECLVQRWYLCEQEVVVKPGDTTLELTRHHTCAWHNPCGPWAPPPP